MTRSKKKGYQMEKGKKEKTYVDIKGGLGNQLFCYAFGYAVAKTRGTELFIDTTMQDNNHVKERKLELLNYNIDYDKRITYKYCENDVLRKMGVNRLRKKIHIGVFTRVYKEKKQYVYDSEVFGSSQTVYYDGFWQSYKYFDSYRENLLKMLTLNRGLAESGEKLLREMTSTNSVAIHVRRGDYVGLNWNIPMNYYLLALDQIRKELKDELQFYIFTDDKEFTHNYFKQIAISNASIYYVEYESDNYVIDDLFLMSKCKHNIIANSSYSWWAAYLNTNEDKIVICPDFAMWTGDFYPIEWNRIKIE